MSRMEPVAWITRQVLKPNQTVTGDWQQLLVSSRQEDDTWSAVYTADQIRSLVEEVRADLTQDAPEGYGWAVMDTCNVILARLEGDNGTDS